ncbi:MAG: type II CRISPR RNA-guided endonuclease Cas9, partial [Bacteroidetes bacterium]
MSKILGLDLGTNSIGWAVVEYEKEQSFKLIDKGVLIFQEGVKIEKGIESSKAAERTRYRSARRLKYRRKLRKIQTILVLSDYGFIPEVSKEELNLWRYKKIYPENPEFRKWQLTDEEKNENPYFFRDLAVKQKLDLNKKEEKYKLGRAFYHIAQRRGFISNRLETTKESDGAVKQEIDKLSKEKGDRTLGQYFYECYKNKQKIRKHYTHRELHYLEEFNRICDIQNLNKEFREKLKQAIFFQRPLKSQKGLIGKCPFEKNKPRCSVSHPFFEEYRMLCFLNHIKIQTEANDKMRTLTQSEKDTIIPLFFRKSKPHFQFDDICKKLTPKGITYEYYQSRAKYEKVYLFNFKMNTTVSGCPTIAHLIDVFEEPLETNILKHYTLQTTLVGNKTYEDIINDIWHVLFTYDNTEKLVDFAKSRLQLDPGKAIKFSKISLKNDYASLSLKAIRKILPWLRSGLIYSHAVFLAKLEDILPEHIWSEVKNRDIVKSAINELINSQKTEIQLNEIVNGLIKNCQTENASWSERDYWQNAIKSDISQKLKSYFGINTWMEFPDDLKVKFESEVFDRFKVQMNKNVGRGEFIKSKRLEERVKDFLQDNFGIADSALFRIYHPSDVETYKKSGRDEDGNFYLGSPRVDAVRNPMAMRCLHQLRKVVNEMLSEGLIDNDTKINIEMARDLNDSNERKAIQIWQRDRETRRKEYFDKIKELYKSETGKDIEPTSEEVLKYQLWEEQNHKCLYTGQQIGISQFIGADPEYDLEHTIPQSISLDNSHVNLTLCSNKFNREIKRNKIPAELANHDEILARLDHWKDKFEDLENQIEKSKRASRSASEKEIKDRIIQKRHRLRLEHDYWYGKYKRFTMKDVPEGFKNSQLNDTRIITKYACQYLKTSFEKVYTVKGTTVADFRVMWGLQSDFAKKERVNHIHHCIDAVTIACITRKNYDELAHYYYELKQWEYRKNANKPVFRKPWETFTEDVKNFDKDVLISHFRSE